MKEGPKGGTQRKGKRKWQKIEGKGIGNEFHFFPFKKYYVDLVGELPARPIMRFSSGVEAFIMPTPNNESVQSLPLGNHRRDEPCRLGP